MKKLFLIILVFVTTVCFSLELAIKNKYPIDEGWDFYPFLFYFKDVLFSSKAYILYAKGEQMIPVFEKSINEELSRRGRLYLSDDLTRIFYSVEDSTPLGTVYEIIVNDKKVSYKKYTMNGKGGIKEYIKKKRRIIEIKGDKTLMNGKYYIKGNEGDVNKPRLFIADEERNCIYDLQSLFKGYYLYEVEPSVSIINRHKNILALEMWRINSQNLREDYVVEVSIIYDGVVNDNRVRVRSAPNLDGEVKGHLNKGDAVKITDRSDSKQPIDDMEDYWYLVRTDSGQEGWMYGAYVDMEE